MVDSEDACKFCLLGSMSKVYIDDGRQPVSLFCDVETALQAEISKLGFRPNITDFNDNNDHSEIMALLDRAIARAIGQENGL